MKYKAEAIKNYNFKSSDQLLLDTNIWVFIYFPQKPNDPKVKIYSQAFANILHAQSRIYIDVLIVSEFINTCARIQWKLIAPRVQFKHFRKSQDFKFIVSAIAADVRRVLQHCSRIEVNFESLAINDLINEYEAGSSDFNDQILVALCKKEGLKLITDDSDFCSQEISILTANNKLLNYD